jgi:hypothetical protein
MPEEELTPECQRLILMAESVLHFLVKTNLTREQAIDIKRRFQLPLGVLNKRFDLQPNGNGRRIEKR